MITRFRGFFGSDSNRSRSASPGQKSKKSNSSKPHIHQSKTGNASLEEEKNTKLSKKRKKITGVPSEKDQDDMSSMIFQSVPSVVVGTIKNDKNARNRSKSNMSDKAQVLLLGKPKETNDKQKIAVLSERCAIAEKKVENMMNSNRYFDERIEALLAETEALKKERKRNAATIEELKEENATMKERVDVLEDERKENEMRMIEMEREMEALKARDLSNYKSWKFGEVLSWMLSIEDDHGEKVLMQYQDVLSKEIESEDLKGSDLKDVTPSDLKGLGIQKFAIRKLVHKRIQELIASASRDIHGHHAEAPVAAYSHQQQPQPQQVYADEVEGNNLIVTKK